MNAEAVIWSQKAFGKPFHDTYWQTETGSIVITNFLGMEIRPGSMGKAFPGIVATVVDPKTIEPITTPGSVGLIALKPGWPSMFRAYWNNKEIYDNKFKTVGTSAETAPALTRTVISGSWDGMTT